MKPPVYRRGARTRGRMWLVRGAARKAISLAINAADLLMPKRQNRLSFSSDKGLKYNGNPRELFEALASDPAWDVYWLTSSQEIYDSLLPRFPRRVVKSYSIKGLLVGLTSKWLCVSHSRYDLGPFSYLSRPRFLYLNHGTPLKSMGYAKAYEDPGVVNAARAFGAVTCCSPFEAALWCRAYNLPASKMWITGVPRNDRLFRPAGAAKARLEIGSEKKLILFAPTYRESGLLGAYLPIPDLDPRPLVELLDSFNAVLAIRPHYYEWSAAQQTIDKINSSRVISADESIIPDVNDLLPEVDILITDYSSLYFDFLLLDRPIIFSCYDRADYERERGFMIDYDENTPGFKVTDSAGFIEALKTELSGTDPFHQTRRAIRDRFHKFTDDKSAARIADRIKQV